MEQMAKDTRAMQSRRVLGVNHCISQYLIIGRDAENGTSPTEGSNGQFVHVCLRRAPGQDSNSTHLLVIADKHENTCSEKLPHTLSKEEYHHDLGNQGRIHITTCGGAGGRGGNGGNGEGGGPGTAGMNATADSNGTDGGPGGNGGAAGSGTSGAKGGNAGALKLIIKEEDLDLLVAVDCLLAKGGRGGQAGVNGNPGLGGIVGPGGTAYTS